MKICILTQPLYTNYGGILQAYALQYVLKKEGHEVVTDRFGAGVSSSFYKPFRFVYYFIQNYILGNKQYNPYQYYFTFKNIVYKSNCEQIAVDTNRFINQHITTIDFFCGKSKPTTAMLGEFNALVVGSDQVWRPIYGYVPAYFLDFVKKHTVKRIAYAASFGVDHWDELTQSMTKKCAKAAQLFDAISVREKSGIELCKTYLNVEAEHLLDPTLLLEKEDYLQLIEEKDKEINGTVMMCYLLDKSPEKKAIAIHLSEQLGLSLLEVAPEEKLTFETKDVTKCIYPSVSKWLSGFKNAEFVITDSFHGTVFALIFNKPFIAISNPFRGASRFTSLLSIFKLEDRLIYSLGDLSGLDLLSIDFVSVNRIKKEWQGKSFCFFKKYL